MPRLFAAHDMIPRNHREFPWQMKQLILNADDFGLTQGINRGIIRAHREGILTSATLMATGRAFEDACRLARENPQLSVGCHLVLVGGKSVMPSEEIPSGPRSSAKCEHRSKRFAPPELNRVMSTPTNMRTHTRCCWTRLLEPRRRAA